jgi:FkbM family methyltransferase
MANELIGNLIQSLGKVGRVLPEGRVKDFMRNFRDKCYDPMDRLVRNIHLQEDGSLVAELSNGVKVYAEPDVALDHPLDIYSQRKYRSWYEKDRRFGSNTIGSFRTFWFTLREIYVSEMYEEYYDIKEGNVVVDAGANIGLFTLKAAKAVGHSGMVIAIEPEMNNFRLLNKNVSANGLVNVVAIHKGLWSETGKSKLFVFGQRGHHSMLRSRSETGYEEVEVDTLDNLLDSLAVKKIDFVKMDIEGAEFEACQGMNTLLGTAGVQLAIETHDDIVVNQTEVIASWLEYKEFEVHVKPIRAGEGMIYCIKR